MSNSLQGYKYKNKSCDFCRLKKLKCTRELPACQKCKGIKILCTFNDVLKKRGPPKGYTFNQSRFKRNLRPTAVKWFNLSSERIMTTMAPSDCIPEPRKKRDFKDKSSEVMRESGSTQNLNPSKLKWISLDILDLSQEAKSFNPSDPSKNVVSSQHVNYIASSLDQAPQNGSWLPNQESNISLQKITDPKGHTGGLDKEAVVPMIIARKRKIF
ncbi:hypothetical protein DSO57_1023698 [Entomophthora muscae]|uniref:Uncharacterized protein n=1 Tax=Entomophthora muscae TaxID=34485 RepID=A0ACC2SRQ6_9FUNG|nr:hypothetical protein DSO57_1023698 [Entomophthora muscae]